MPMPSPGRRARGFTSSVNPTQPPGADTPPLLNPGKVSARHQRAEL